MKLCVVLLAVLATLLNGGEAEANFPDETDPSVQLIFSYALNAAEKLLADFENASDSAAAPITLPALQPEIHPPTVFLQPEPNSANDDHEGPSEVDPNDSSSSSESASAETCPPAVNNLYIIVSPANSASEGAAKSRVALSFSGPRSKTTTSTEDTSASNDIKNTVQENRIKYGCGPIATGEDDEVFRPIRAEDLDIERLGSIMKSGVKNGLDLYALADMMIDAVAQDVSRGQRSREGGDSLHMLPKEVVQSLDQLIDREGLAQGTRDLEDAEYTDDAENGQLDLEVTKVKLDNLGGKIQHSIIVQADKIENQVTENFKVEVMGQGGDFDAETKAFLMGTILTLGLAGLAIAFWKFFKNGKQQQMPNFKFMENQKVPTISFA